MSNWGGGYVTDVAYMPGYYRQQTPTHLNLACLLGGVMAATPEPDAPFQYLELGCGRGFGALILAASNPAWQVTAIDFNPAHIAEARSWAAAAGIGNVVFLEADLSTLAEDELARAIPEADAVSLHGVWSWVPQAVRDGIVRLLRAKVAPGGVVHISYNALPGWQGAVGMQRLLRESGRRLSTRSDRQVEAGVKFLQEMSAAGATHLTRQPLVQAMLARMPELPVAYLSHEYMNENWLPCFHADVAEALSAAKLDFVSSAQLPENFPELTLSDEQRALYRRFDDPAIRELIKDMCLERGLRHDVFVRGARRISNAERDAALRQVTLGLLIAPQDFQYEADMPVGKANLGEAFYGPVVRALANGPRRVDELLSLPGGGGTRDNPAELVGLLVGLDSAMPVLRPGAPPAPAALRLNRIAAERLTRPENLDKPAALASTAMGAGIPATVFDLFVQSRLQLGEDIDRIDDWAQTLSAPMNPEGQEAIRKLLRSTVERRLPILRTLSAI
jgi:SAM-dependent methyltransferase